MSVAHEPFGTLGDGRAVERHTLRNARGMEVAFLSYGGRIVSLRVPDRTGAFANVVLGDESLSDYLADAHYLGALIGRYANRIAGGRFVLDGRRVELTRNDGANHLHGGPHGFHAALWTVTSAAERDSSSAVLAYESPTGEEGYPGALRVQVTYALAGDDALTVEYRAQSDAPTPVNLTQHSYFNLAGRACDVRDHELTLAASRVTPVSAGRIPTGELRAVRGTPFDFTSARTLRQAIASASGDAQLQADGGFDHNFVLDGGPSASGEPAFAARLYEPQSGRSLDIFTTEPGLQLYTGNALGAPGSPGQHEARFVRHGGVALETQHFPDSPNHPDFPSTILRPGVDFRSRTIYRFGVS